MRPRFPALIAAAVLVLSSVSAPQSTVTDDQGRVFRLGPPPRRIVSLAPNVTEVLFALGLGERVVGVTRYCDYPPEARSKTRVGGLLDPSPERIKALDPDLVIAFRGNPLPALQKLRRLGLSVFVLDIGNDLESVYPFLDKIGRLTGRESESRALVERLKAKARSVLESLEPVAHEPRVFLALHGSGLWTCGRVGYLTDLVHRARAKNIAASTNRRWVNYSRERLLSEDPEAIIILAKTPEDFRKAKDWWASEASLKNIWAVREGRFYLLDENKTSRFGPRLFEALEELALALHPGLEKGSGKRPDLTASRI